MNTQERIAAAHARQARLDRIDRTVKTARTYLRKAEAFLYPYRGESDEVVEPLPASPAYWDLLDVALETALAVVEALPEDFFESTPVGDPFGLSSALGLDSSRRHNSSDEPLAAAEKLVAAFRARRAAGERRILIAKLENTTGRTEAEAEAFRAKAAALRGQP